MDERTTSELVRVLKNIRNAEELEKYTKEEIQGQADAFYTYFNSYLEKKKISKAEVIQKSGIARTYGYQILQGERCPSRDKVLALALAAGMDKKEVNRCLKIAGMNELYPKVRRDAIILFALDKSLGMLDLDELLYEMGEPTFSTLDI